MKLNSTLSKILTNKWVLNVVSVISFLNVIGYMIMGNFNIVLFFIVLAGLVRYFSQNMIIVLGVPLIIVNLFAMKQTSYGLEGMETPKGDNKKEEKPKEEPSEEPAKQPAKQPEDSFEVGRKKNGTSKIDYASTIEDAYDDLNKILGSDGMKSLTEDTQRLMKQQMELAQSMKQMTPIVEKMLPMAEQAQKMMSTMDGNGMSNLMEMAKKMSGGLGIENNENKETK